MKRWYERFRLINNGKAHNQSSDYSEDEIYAFFINCYHLKDWIKNDDAVSIEGKEKLEKFIKGSDYMNICEKVCNGIKHLNRDKLNGIGRDFSLGLGTSHIPSQKFLLNTN